MDDLIRKVKKLLALANSCNEHEARIAAGKAQELLLRHNLDIQEVKSKDLNYEEKEVHEVTRMNKMTSLILQVLESSYFVTTFWRRRLKEFEGTSRWTIVSKIHIYGTTTNVLVATYVFDFLNLAYPRLWASYRARINCPVSARNSYYLGLSQGIVSQLSLNQKRVESERGLVLIEDPELTKKSNECRGIRSKAIERDDDAMEAGFEEGLKLNISRAIESDSGSSGLLIEA